MARRGMSSCLHRLFFVFAEPAPCASLLFQSSRRRFACCPAPHSKLLANGAPHIHRRRRWRSAATASERPSEKSPLSDSEREQLRTVPAPYPKADIAAMSPQQREALRLRSKAIPLVVSHEPLDILFEDDVFLVVSKPSWLKMHPIHRFQGGTLLNRVIGYLGRNPHMCHRLDMHTTGVVMFLKESRHCASVAASFREGRVAKQYLCIVDSQQPPDEAFTVNAPIERHPTIGIMRQIGSRTAESKDAVTNFRLASPPGMGACGMSLLCAMPKTGRTHQIRLHCRAAGLPIVGDDVYGRERQCYDSIDHVRKCASDPELALYADGNPYRAGLKLHAWQVAVDHPVTGERMVFCAPPPVRFVDLAESEGLAIPDPVSYRTMLCS